MKKLIPIFMSLLLLCSCSGKTAPRTLEYTSDGLCIVAAADVTYHDYHDAAIADLILSSGDYSKEYVTFEKSGDSFNRTDSGEYKFHSQNQVAPTLLAREENGATVFPEQFIKYTLDGKIYYSINGVTADNGYSASADGKIMIFKSSDGLLVKYDAGSNTLTPAGATAYNGKTYSEFPGWVLRFAIDESGRYIAFTSARAETGGNDLWLLDLSTGEEKMLKQNILVNGDLAFSGNEVYYLGFTNGDSGYEYNYYGINVQTGSETIIEWDNGTSYLSGGKIVGPSKIYDIAQKKTYSVSSSVGGNTPKTILSDDGKYTVSVSGDESALNLVLTDAASGNQEQFRLPSDFIDNYIDFGVIGMRGNTVILQCMFYSGDKSGDYTAYYTIDLSFIFDNK